MITLNLLSPEQKEKIEKTAIYSICENLIATLFIAVTIIAIILLISRDILENKYDYYISRVTNPPPEITQLNQNVKKINTDLKTITEIQNGFKKYSLFLTDFNQLVPKQVQITYLGLASDPQKPRTLQIQGEAADREKLLTFQKNLENSSLFTQVKSPLSNILQQKNVEFNFDVILSDS